MERASQRWLNGPAWGKQKGHPPKGHLLLLHSSFLDLIFPNITGDPSDPLPPGDPPTSQHMGHSQPTPGTGLGLIYHLPPERYTQGRPPPLEGLADSAGGQAQPILGAVPPGPLPHTEGNCWLALSNHLLRCVRPWAPMTWPGCLGLPGVQASVCDSLSSAVSSRRGSPPVIGLQGPVRSHCFRLAGAKGKRTQGSASRSSEGSAAPTPRGCLRSRPPTHSSGLGFRASLVPCSIK